MLTKFWTLSDNSDYRSRMSGLRSGKLSTLGLRNTERPILLQKISHLSLMQLTWISLSLEMNTKVSLSRRVVNSFYPAIIPPAGSFNKRGRGSSFTRHIIFMSKRCSKHAQQIFNDQNKKNGHLDWFVEFILEVILLFHSFSQRLASSRNRRQIGQTFFNNPCTTLED